LLQKCGAFSANAEAVLCILVAKVAEIRCCYGWLAVQCGVCILCFGGLWCYSGGCEFGLQRFGSTKQQFSVRFRRLRGLFSAKIRCDSGVCMLGFWRFGSKNDGFQVGFAAFTR